LARTDRAEFKRLTLQIERDLLSQTHLRVLLVSANAAVAGHQQDLRALKARLARARRRASTE
jgi:hypothetical protein